MAKVKLELGKKNAADKVELGNKVVTQMTGNPNFTTPNPTLDAVSDAAGNVSAAIGEVETARKLVQTKVSILDQYESVLDGLLSQLSAYVENISNGDETIILSSGMDVQKERGSSGLPEKVSLVTATPSQNSG